MKIRSLHPDFFTDAKVTGLSFGARILFQGLWCRSDDYGRGRMLEKAIEGDVFPRDDVDITALLDELVRGGLIRLYQSGQDQFYFIPTWEKYQSPKYRAKSSIPEPPDESPGQMDPGQSGDNPGESAPDFVPGEGEGEGDITPPPPTELPAVKWARRWAEMSGTPFTAAVKRSWVPKVQDFIGAGGEPSEALLEAARRKGIESPGGWGFVDPGLVAEAERVGIHRDCEDCKGAGFVEEYASGAGMVKVPCLSGRSDSYAGELLGGEK